MGRTVKRMLVIGGLFCLSFTVLSCGSGGTGGVSTQPNPQPKSPAPSVVSTSPVSNATGTAQLLSISVTFSESLDPGTVNSATFVLSQGAKSLPASVSYNPAAYTVTLLPDGVFEPGETYTVTVDSSVESLQGTPMGSHYTWSFTTQSPTGVSAVVKPPSGLNPTALTVLSFGGNESTPSPDGSTTVELRPLGTSLVAAMFPAEPFGLMAITIADSNGVIITSPSTATKIATLKVGGQNAYKTAWQITASRQAASAPDTVTLDFQTTAESLLFLTPYFFNQDPVHAKPILAAIATDPSTEVLAQALEGAWNEPDPLADPGVQSALQTAIISIWGTLTTDSGATTLAASTSLYQETQKSSSFSSQASAATTTAGSGSLVSATPYCWNDPNHTQAVTSGLQCLDLDFINIPVPASTDSSGNYNFAPTNCNNPDKLFAFVNLGCATSWLVRVAPMSQNVPPSGVDAIQSTTASFGPYSPTGPYTNACVTTQSCQAVAWLPAESNFRYLNLVGDAGNLIAGALGLNSLPPAGSFTLPGHSQANFAVRAYSGGFADSQEFSNVIAGDYTDGLNLWASALAQNGIQSGLEYWEALGIAPDAALNCVVANIDKTTTVAQIITQIETGDFSSSATFQAVFETAVNAFMKSLIENAGGCVQKTALQSFLQESVNISKWISGVGTVLKTLNAASNVGQASQRIFELTFKASAAETGIVSVGGAAALVAKLQLSCPASTITVNQEETCTAMAFDSSGNPITSPGFQIQWSWDSSATGSVIQVANSASNGSTVIVTGMAPGTTSLTAYTNGANGTQPQASESITVAQVVVSSSLPTITALSPDTAAVGTGSQIVAIRGQNFVENSTVVYHGIEHPAILVTSAELVITLSTSDLATVGTYPVVVTNPAPGGGISNTVDFTVGNPVPSITSLSPGSVTVGSPAQALTINGSNFLSSSTVSFNGSTRAATLVSNTQLTIALTATDLATAGTFPVSVTNPTPGGGASNVADFTVLSGGAGSVTLSPTAVTVPVGGAQTFTASVAGSSNGVTWSIQEGSGGGTIANSTTAAAVYLPPSDTGTFHLVATNADDPTQTAVATVTVVPPLTLTTLHAFQSTQGEGYDPVGSLIQASDGNFYGTTTSGGASNNGTVFKVDSTGNFTTVHSFSGTDGGIPDSGLIQASDGNFYGTTFYGGAFGRGEVFKINLSGNFSILASFNEPGPVNPYAGLIQATDGQLYGTTYYGGPSEAGTAFKVDTSGNVSWLHSFSSSEGAPPWAGAIQASDGNFYGTLYYGGAGGGTGAGTVYRMDGSGNVTVLHSFSFSDGAGPFAGLFQGSDGNLYGTTTGGGAFGHGTVFKVGTGGDFTVLHSFSDYDGSGPQGGLIQGADGNFYGTTPGGGPSGGGTIFRMDSQGNVTVLFSFDNSDGLSPPVAPIMGTDGNLYGVTEYGGAGGAGTVYRLNLH